MVYITSILALLAPLTLTLATPTLLPRAALAGGPAIVPIPANCTLTSITPADGALNFTLTPSFIAASQVFSQLDTPGENSLTEAQWNEQCLEQCYGFGNDGDCVGVLLAENVTMLEFGFEETGWGCLFVGANITQADLLETTDGSYANAQAINRWCPSPRVE